MRECTFRRIWLTALCASTLAVAPVAAQAADSHSDDDWQYKASLYLWGAGAKGTTASFRDASGNRIDGSDIDIDVGFDTLLKNLNMAFMGDFEVRKGRWSLLTDVIYLNVEANTSGSVPVSVLPGLSPTLKVDADVKLKAWLLNLIGGYNVWRTEQGTLDLLAGARYFDLQLDFGLGVNVGRVAPSTNLSPYVSAWDAVIGVKGHVDLNEQWYVPYYLDIGTGQSDSTWQALAGVGYRFGWGNVSLTYRYVDWEFGSGDAINDFSLSGPLLAATFHF